MPKLLYFCTEDWAFLLHFRPMAQAARAAGFEVVVATRVRRHEAELSALADRIVPLETERGSLGPFELVRSLARMIAIVRAERPEIVHCIALRMVVLGGIASRLGRAKQIVLAPTGLGYLWLERDVLARAGRFVARIVVGRLLRGPRTRYLFENADDPREFGLDVRDRAVTLVGGAGVDPERHPVVPEPPAPPVTVAVVARMLKPKGIAEAVGATRLARARGAAVELHLFGAPDPANRTSYTPRDLDTWAAEDGVFWHGSTDDPARVYREHHVAMLLSHREGLPKSLVEAAACGRPIVTTDVPGCRDVVRQGIEGILVPSGEAEGAADALVRLAADPALRARLGAAARARFLDRFTEAAVMRTVTDLYRGTGGSSAQNANAGP